MRVQRAFTLVELLVTLSIIALLVSILLPALATAREGARMAACQSNMRQLGIWGLTYTMDHQGVLPHGADGSYIFAPLRAVGTWSDDVPMAAPRGGYSSGPTGSPYLAHAGVNGRKRILQPSVLNCPELAGLFPLRWWDAGNTCYNINRHLGGRGEAYHPYRVPTDDLLRSDRYWFSEGALASTPFVGSGVANVRRWTDLVSSAGADNYPMWWPARAQFLGFGQGRVGHPSRAANFLYGDGHVAAMTQTDLTAMGGDYRTHVFAGRPR